MEYRLCLEQRGPSCMVIQGLESLVSCLQFQMSLSSGEKSMTTKKNYYVCLRFSGRPELHMTVRYLKNLTPSAVARVTEIIDGIMEDESAEPFTPIFNLEGWYGPRHTVRVLQASSKQVWPVWLTVLQADLPDGRSEYHPHMVVCKDKQLAVEVVAVSLMCKKEVTRWDLT